MIKGGNAVFITICFGMHVTILTLKQKICWFIPVKYSRKKSFVKEHFLSEISQRRFQIAMAFAS